MYEKYLKIKCLKWTYGLFGHIYKVTKNFIFYITVSEIFIPSLNSIGNSNIPKSMT